MKRLEFSEKKQLALEFIAKISEGYRLTGPNKAFDEAMKGREAAITQSCLYQFIRGDEELSQAYFKARDESRKCIMGGSKQLGMEKRKELLALIIENISSGMNIRGDTYRANAVVEACKALELPLVHWATVHRWLRTENKELQESFKSAMLIHRNNLRELADKNRLESLKIEDKYKKDIRDARQRCVDKIENARKQRKSDFIKARMKKLTAKKELKKKLQESYRAALNSAKNKLHACAECGKIATGGKYAN